MWRQQHDRTADDHHDPAGPTTVEPAWTEDELAIIAVHQDFRNATYELLTNPESDVSIVAPFATPGLGAGMADVVEGLRQERATYSGTYEFSVTSIDGDGGEAVMWICSMDAMSGYRDGELARLPDEDRLPGRLIWCVCPVSGWSMALAKAA